MDDSSDGTYRPDRLKAALRWSAVLCAGAAVLPVEVDAGAAVWPWKSADHPAGLAAAVALAAAGPLLGLLAWLRGRVTNDQENGAGEGPSEAAAKRGGFLLALGNRAIVGAGALGVLWAAAVALLSDTETRASLLPYVPLAWGKGGPLFLLALCLAGTGAALRRHPKTPCTPGVGPTAQSRGAPSSTFLAAAALGLTALLYVWPHRTGSLAGTVVTALAAASRYPAFAMNALIALLPAFAVGLGAWVALRRAAPRPGNVAWMIAFTPAVLLALSFKAGATFRVDALVPVGLRAAALWIAAPLTAVAGLHAVLEDRSRRRKLLLGLAALAIAGAGLTGFAVRQSEPAVRPWKLGPGPSWALELYERDLLDVVFAVSRSTGPTDPGELDRAIAAAVERAAPLPELAVAIGELGKLVRDVPENRRAIERQGDRLNEAARAAGLPFYADVNVMGVRDGRSVRWIFYVKTYRIRRVRTAQLEAASYGVLWLERLDDTNVVERLLGWKKTSLPYASVILDKISGLWRDEILSALAFAGAPGDPYADVADALREDLEAELDEPQREALGAAIDCLQEQGPRAAGCEAELDAIEASVVEVLARVVEAHELQHVIDAGHVDAPAPLLARMTGFGDDSVDAAADELSAYLAEMGRSQQPRLALGHLRAVSRRSRAPEAFAGAVLLEALRRPGEDETALLALGRDELRARARAAYRALFGSNLPLPEQVRDERRPPS